MKLPFTSAQFLEVFKNYNQSVFPAQVLFYLFALAIIFLAFKKKKHLDKIIVLLLSTLWLWMGVVYHLIFFTAINKAAFLFGLVFIFQGLILLYFGLVKNKLSFQLTTNFFGVAGLLFILFALVLYPLIGYSLGHIYPSAPTFGLPCPTTIFTFGIFLWSNQKFPPILLIIPLLWSFIGFSAALSLGIIEDTGLLIAALSGTTLMIIFNQKPKAVSAK